MREGLSLAVAGLVAPLAATLYWLALDDIPVERAFSSPFPYVLVAFSWFVATPIYAVLHSWVGSSLRRLLLLASLGVSPFAAWTTWYFLSPRDLFAALAIFSTAWVGAAAFWLVLRVLLPDTRV